MRFYVRGAKWLAGAAFGRKSGMLPVLAGPLKGLQMPKEAAAQSLGILLGTYEPHVIAKLAALPLGKRVAYDVGAHFGCMSLALGSRGRRVFAFEPVPENIMALNRVVAVNGLREDVTVISAAVAENNCRRRLILSASSFLGRLEDTFRDSENKGLSIDVDARTLDSFVFDEGNPPPDFIKIDVEGAESLVVEGSLRVLDEYAPDILMEIHGPDNLAAVRERLKDLGYGWDLLSSEGNQVPMDPEQAESLFSKERWTCHFYLSRHASRKSRVFRQQLEKDPQVSVVIPVRNRPGQLVRCLDSFLDRNTASGRFEVLVCDDGSTDDLSTLIAKYRKKQPAIRLLTQPPKGPASARNLGINAARAPVVVFIDSDVEAGTDAIDKLATALLNYPDWVGAEARLIPTDGESGPLWEAPVSEEGARYHTAAIAYRREALLKAGGFDEMFSLPACEDTEVAARMLKIGKIGYVADAAVYHPRRRVTLASRWNARRHWKYLVVLAKRYSFLAFPGRPVGWTPPRLRIALAALITLPLGRLRQGARTASLRACGLAFFDIVCGAVALPSILFSSIPERKGLKFAPPCETRTAVIVSAHRPYPTLERCLRGFAGMVKEARDLIFVDNGSAPRISDRLQDAFPGVTVLRLEKNRLFCAGYNAGLKRALDEGYDFALIVNADTEVVNPHLLEELGAAARRRRDAAFFGPRVSFRGSTTVQNTCLFFPSVIRNLLTWVPWRLGRPLFRARSREKEREVEFLNGVCVLCRCSALRDIGLMDELFGGYVEDADWGWRARCRGWKSVYVPIPSVIHHEETAGYEHFSLKSFLLKRNTVLWFLKTGRKTSASFYSKCSIALGKARLLCARSADQKEKHSHFLRKLRAAYDGLLAGQIPGEWFGPPLGPWED